MEFCILEAKEIKDEDKTGVYWQIKMPLFIDNRDVKCFYSFEFLFSLFDQYTFVREFGEYDIGNRHFYYVLTRSDRFKTVSERKKVVRIESYISQTLLCSDGNKGLRCKINKQNQSIERSLFVFSIFCLL